MSNLPIELCAEPGCTSAITPRKGGQTFFLHCEDHRTQHCDLPADYPEAPAKWGREQCHACPTVFEKYRVVLDRNLTGRHFCSMTCRDTVGSKPSSGSWWTCEECGKEFQGKGKKRRHFCSLACSEAHVLAQPKTRSRRERHDHTVKLCEYQGCDATVDTKLNANGQRRKFCEEHRHTNAGRKKGTADSSKKVTLVCDHCDKEFQRYRVNIQGNTTDRFFCSAACRIAAGSKPRRGEERQCVVCEKGFYARPSQVAADRDYCSTKCHDVGRQVPRIERPCAKCGTTMVLREADPQKYCSMECAGKVNPKIPMDCQWCEREFMGRPDAAFCSKRCFYESQSANAQGAMTKSGYRVVADGEGNFRPEHRIVMEKALGRPLLDSDQVHHLNALRWDNRLENLLWMTGSHPAGAAVGDMYDWCQWFIREHEAEVLRLREQGQPMSMRDSVLSYDEQPHENDEIDPEDPAA